MPDQRVPKSLGILMRALRVLEGLTAEEIGAQLTEAPGRFAQGEKFLRATVSKIEKAKVGLYSHHARYANWAGLPVGLLMSISRVSANLRDQEPQLARAFGEVLIGLGRQVIRDADQLAAIDPATVNDDDLKFLKEYRASCRERLTEGKKRRRERVALIARRLILAVPEEKRELFRADAKARHARGYDHDGDQ